MKNVKRNVYAVLALALALMLITPSLHAQHSRFGIKGGVNLSNMYTNDVNDKNTKIGFNGGVFLKAALSDHFAIQPEVLLTMKGAELDYNNDFVSGTGNFSLNYVEVPLLAVINITPNFNIHGGVYAASLINVTVTNKGTISSFDFAKDLGRDNFETLDYGLVGGIGFNFNLVSFGVRYDYGMNTVGKSYDFSGVSHVFPDGKNSALQLYLGISFF
jgi:hypothetical protein